jgi:hypothetical protein
MSELADRLMIGSFTHADENNSFTNRHDVAALEAAPGEVFVRVAKPKMDLPIFEGWMELINCSLE